MRVRIDNNKMQYTCCSLGYHAGCVSEERYLRCQSVQRQLTDNTALLEDFSLPRSQWSKLFNSSTQTSEQFIRSALRILLSFAIRAGHTCYIHHYNHKFWDENTIKDQY